MVSGLRATTYEGKLDELELDFMAGLLCMDPARRLTGAQCLQHPYLADLAGTDMAPALALRMARSSNRSSASPNNMRTSYTGGGTPDSSVSASSSGLGWPPGAEDGQTATDTIRGEVLAGEGVRVASSGGSGGLPRPGAELPGDVGEPARDGGQAEPDDGGAGVRLGAAKGVEESEGQEVGEEDEDAAWLEAELGRGG